MTKTYIVPFQAEEIVWNNCIAKVEANSKEEALEKVEKSVENSNPLFDFNTDWDGTNTVTNECIETIQCKMKDDFEVTVYHIKEFDDRIRCELSHTAFDIARYGKDDLYKQAENIFLEVGLTLDILEMDMVPTAIEEHFVTYECIPTEYKRIFRDESFVHMKDGKKIEGNFDE